MKKAITSLILLTSLFSFSNSCVFASSSDKPVLLVDPTPVFESAKSDEAVLTNEENENDKPVLLVDPTPVFESAKSDEAVLTNEENENDKPVLLVDPTPVFEGGKSTRAAKVTASDVFYDWVSWGVEAKGYVTVMDGNTPYKHYTRVQINSLDGKTVWRKSKDVWGTGEVWATTGEVTQPDPYDSIAKVYYGW